MRFSAPLPLQMDLGLLFGENTGQTFSPSLTNSQASAFFFRKVALCPWWLGEMGRRGGVGHFEPGAQNWPFPSFSKFSGRGHTTDPPAGVCVLWVGAGLPPPRGCSKKKSPLGFEQFCLLGLRRVWLLRCGLASQMPQNDAPRYDN